VTWNCDLVPIQRRKEMRRFNPYLRNGVYYARLYNPKTGEFLTAKSTGKVDRDEAAGITADWLKNVRH
jgi:hypothetical protein